MIIYRFVRIGIEGLFNPTPRQDYREIIKENAAEGWRLIQVFAPGNGPYGRPTFFDLIFERDSDGE